MSNIATIMSGLLLFGSLCAWPAFAQTPLLLVTSDFPPYVFCQQDSRSESEEATKGIDVDILVELFQRLGQPYDIHCLPWKRALAMVKDGEAAGGFPGFKTPEREAFAQFMDTPLHVSSYNAFVRQGDEFPFETVDDFAGKRIGIERGHDVSPAFAAAVRAGKFQVEEASAPEQNLKKLLAGRVDVYINNHHVALHTAKRLGMLGRIAMLPNPVAQGKPSYLLISNSATIPDKPRFMQRLNQTLAGMWRDGSVERITERCIQAGRGD